MLFYHILQQEVVLHPKPVQKHPILSQCSSTKEDEYLIFTHIFYLSIISEDILNLISSLIAL